MLGWVYLAGSDPFYKLRRVVTDAGIRGYLSQNLRADAIAGLTVAVMGVPQAMAYAIIAGLPPVYGLYTAIVTCAVAAILGSSRHLVTGPTNGLCMVMASLTAHMIGLPIGDKLQVILLLSFMAGVIQLGFGLLRLGGIVRYVSNSVVIGFTAGAGILIAINQLKSVTGVEYPDDVKPTRTWEVAYETVIRFGDTNTFALIIGVFTALLVVLIPKIHPRLPGALIAVVTAAVACYFLGWDGAENVKIAQDIEGGIPSSLRIFQVPTFVSSPDWGSAQPLVAGAFAMAILGLIEATSISRSVARSSEQRLDFNREFIGQGASKIVGSFASCFAGSGSFTRTALCFTSGGRTRMAAIFSAIWTLLTLVLLGELANYIPIPALAGLLIVTAYSMVDQERLKLSWRSGMNSRIVLAGTLGATLVLPLENAIFVGVFLSLIVILRTTGKTDLTQLIPQPGGGFDEVPFNRAPATPVVTVNMEGDIYFAAAEDLDAELLRCITPKTKVVVLRMRGLRAVGSTAMSMLEYFWLLLRRRNIRLVVSGIQKELEVVMTSTGVRAKIGEANIFFADNNLFRATELAMLRAQSIADWERQSEVTAKIDLRRDRPGTAREIMNTRCIRFGNRHQLREAMWLMSELYKTTNAISPEPLFLQDREGKLFGELSPWLILDTLLASIEVDKARQLPDDQVARLLRRDFTKPIRLVAQTDTTRQSLDTSLARMLKTAVDTEQDVVPICDDDGRVKGLVNMEVLMRSLRDALAAEEGSTEDGDG